jgi:pimeloyl-ACP methyl ester carboxylesterase
MTRGAIAAFIVLLVFAVAASAADGPTSTSVRVWTVHYRSHEGTSRRAYVMLPSWYGPKNNPPIPLVISPHGRGVSAITNISLWGRLPGQGAFAVISPQGQGRKLEGYSWGSAGQIEDLARMPAIAHLTLPWLRVDPKRVYAVGGSMGGQETLLLLAKHPSLLAGAAALDAVTDLATQYWSFPRLQCDKKCRHVWRGSLGRSLQSLARIEVGGGPRARAAAFAERSPLTYARAIAFSCVPLELWWSTKDKIVLDQSHQSGELYDRLIDLNPNANVAAFVGTWRHSAEMHAGTRLPAVLAWLGLLPPVKGATSGLHAHTPADEAFATPCSR